LFDEVLDPDRALLFLVIDLGYLEEFHDFVSPGVLVDLVRCDVFEAHRLLLLRFLPLFEVCAAVCLLIVFFLCLGSLVGGELASLITWPTAFLLLK